MKLKEIMQMLEELCPRSFAMSWDNVGLQVGYSDKEVETIALALDATSETFFSRIILFFSAVLKISQTAIIWERGSST